MKVTESINYLRVKRGIPNPKGMVDELYLIDGNVSGDNLKIKEDLVKLPKKCNKGKKINIYHINDVHGKTEGRLDSINQLINNMKSDYTEGEAGIFVSCGDDHSEGMLTEGRSEVYREYSKFGMDFGIFGNHDLDEGTIATATALKKDADFTLISSNIIDSQYDLPVTRGAIAVISGIRVGIVGITTFDYMSLGKDLDNSIKVADPYKVAVNMGKALEEHTDIIIAMTHLGYKHDDASLCDGELAKLLDRELTKTSVVIGGHSHSILNMERLEEENKYGKSAVFQAGEYCEYLGEVVISEEDLLYKVDGRLHKI